MAIGPVSPLTLDRYEIKYLIPNSLVEPISKYVSLYCEMDYYSQISPDSFYKINSLYLDTPTLLLLRRKEMGDPGYFSLRIRSYGDEPKPPYYFECKQKNREFSKKRRAKVPIENFGDLFDNPDAVRGFDPFQDKHLQFFMEKAITFNARPVILTQYRRRAFLSHCDDYARVTFDRDMRYMEESNFNVKPDESRMTHYDHTDTIDHANMKVVLELKCERKIPRWMIDLVQVFELTRGGFSKFGGSMYELHGNVNEEFSHQRVSRQAISGLWA